MIIVMKLIKSITHIWHHDNHPPQLGLLGMMWVEMTINLCPL
jgi:hypothetical protein